MDATERAHWRYRVQALEREIPETNRLIKAARDMARDARWPRDYVPTVDELRNPPRNCFDEDVDALNEVSAFEHWLLEEARYKCILGAIEAG